MLTALDAPDEALDDGERKVVAMIREHGWFDNHILAENDVPEFNFTTGFGVTIGAPEILIFSLPHEKAHNLLWSVFRELKTGLRLEVGKSYDEFSNLPVVFLPVAKDHYREYLGWSRWFYAGDQFDCWQMIWPDKLGIFPWQVGFDEALRQLQPDLSQGNWNGMSPA